MSIEHYQHQLEKKKYILGLKSQFYSLGNDAGNDVMHNWSALLLQVVKWWDLPFFVAQTKIVKNCGCDHFMWEGFN